MQGSDIFGNAVKFSGTYLVCMENKCNHRSELCTRIAADAADDGIAVNLFQIPLFTWSAAVSLSQVLPYC